MSCSNTKKKNIMYVFNDTDFGGAGQSLLDILTKIKNQINPTIVIRDDANVLDKFTQLGIKCYKIHFNIDYVKMGTVDEDKRIQDIKQSYEAALELLPVIQKEKIELIHINSSINNFAAIAALKAKIPYVWHIRELMEEHYKCEFINQELKISLYKKADKLITISDYVKSVYYKKYGVETIKLYDGLSIERFKRELSTRGKFDNTFLVASMITPEKGQFDVIRAADILVSRGYDRIKILIVGAGARNYVWALKKYINKKKLTENVFILPFHNDLAQLRSQVSYTITSSQNEALGRVTIEAMLAGNIVIGARSGGTLEIIGSKEERGFLYELHNSESLADAMERAMKFEDEKKDELRLTAQKYAESTFNSKSYCEELIKIYDDALLMFKDNGRDKLLHFIEEYYKTIKDNNQDKMNNIPVNPYKKAALAYPIILKWLEIRQNGHSLSEYLECKGRRNIAIYGMGALGRRLYDELENSSIRVRYLMDKNPDDISRIFEFKEIGEKMPDVDTIVVTVISSQDQIIDELKKCGYDCVIGLNEILDSYDII